MPTMSSETRQCHHGARVVRPSSEGAYGAQAWNLGVIRGQGANSRELLLHLIPNGP